MQRMILNQDGVSRCRPSGVIPVVTSLVIGLSAAVGVIAANVPGKDKVPKSLNGLPLVFHANFEDGSMSRWEPTDRSAWKVEAIDGNRVLSLFKKRSKYKPPVRSPLNRAIVKDLKLRSFVLDLRLQSTVPDYNHRDLCLFFGYQDESHFYYVHIGKRTDDYANQIFIVNDKPRTKISNRTTQGTNWSDDWHHARVVRDVEQGTIEVYFDDMDNPIMTAADKTFPTGQIGVGSFDDTGNFDDIRVFGKQTGN